MKGNVMPHRVVEELKTIIPDVIFNSVEEAREFLIDDGLTLEESIALMDNYADPVWVNNRESLLNTINGVILEWNQDTQILTRTLIFESEELYFNYRSMVNEIFSPTPRTLKIVALEDV